jgi:hypothetical protein
MTTSDHLLLSAVKQVEELEALGVAFLGRSPAILERTSHRIPELNHAELGFIRVTSWLYVLYFEAGKLGLSFLQEQFETYAIDPKLEGRKHIDLVQHLRTFLQHNLDFNTQHDQTIIAQCHEWFRGCSGTAIPTEDQQWRKCLERLLEDAVKFFSMAINCLRSMETDELVEQIRDSWTVRITRYHPPYQFDSLISVVISDMGRELLDVVAFRNRHFDVWTNKLRALTENYSFEIEGRKLIEDALLKDSLTLLPITGTDIITLLGIPPGPEVGRALGLARALYDEKPCNRSTLLERIKAAMAQTTANGV